MPRRDADGSRLRDGMALGAETLEFLARLRVATPEDAGEILSEWRLYLLGLQPSDALGEIEALLDSREDVATGLPFRLREGGHLASWPSLRVAALDFFGEIDADRAAAYSERIFEQKNSPDEWALALRNAAGMEGADATVLTGKGVEMLSHGPWLAAPSAGFLEAFDVVVHTKSPELVTLMSDIISSTDPVDESARFAAFLATDRAAIADPVAVLPHLNDNPDLFEQSEMVRVGLFGRADPGDPAQVAELREYLLRPDLSEAEANMFLRNYPFFDTAVAYSLIEEPPTYSMEEMKRRDREAIDLLATLASDPSLSRYEETIEARIAEITRLLETENDPSP